MARKKIVPPDRKPLILSFNEMMVLRTFIDRRIEEIEYTLRHPRTALEATALLLENQRDILRRPKAYREALQHYKSIEKKLNAI